MTVTVIDPRTITLDNGVLTIGEPGSLHTLQRQTTEVTLEPAVTKKDPIRVLSGGQAPGARTETWTLKGKLLQDFGQADDSIVEWLLTAAGQQLPFSFDPDDSSDKLLTGTLTVEAVSIGGTVGEPASSDFSFELVGRPVIVAKA